MRFIHCYSVINFRPLYTVFFSVHMIIYFSNDILTLYWIFKSFGYFVLLHWAEPPWSMHDIYSMFLLVIYYILRASLVAQTVKNLPAVLETQVWYLGWEDLFKRAWQPTPVFLPGEFHEQRSLVGYSPWDRKESNTTEWLTQHYYVI